jgi:PAS domain S-box-containing protein
MHDVSFGVQWSQFASLSFTAYVAAFLTAALAAFATTPYTRRITDPDTRHGLVALLVASGGWATSHVGFLLVTTPLAKKMFYVGGLIVGFVTVGAWMYFCSAYTGRTLHRNPTVRRASLLLLGLVALVKLTNPLHQLYYTLDYTLTPFPHLTVRHHLLYWLIMGISYALASIGYFMLVEYFGRLSQSTRPIAILVALTGLPPVLNIVGYATPALLDITYEPIGVAAFAVGALHVYRRQFQAVHLAGEHDEPALVLSADRRIRDFNTAAADLFADTNVQAAIGQPVHQVVPALAEIGQSDRSVVSFERDAEPRYFQIAESRFGAGGTRSGRLLLLADITERVRAERALRASRERWRRLVESHRDALIIAVAGTIRYANPAAAALFKADSPDDMVGRPLSDWMMPASPSSTLQTRMDSIEQGRPVSPHEHTIPRRDGTSRTVESYAVPIDHQGEDAAQVILRDITERKRRQQQLQQAQRMETVGTLAGGIAHDFNNILHTVEASVEMVRQNLPDEGPDRVLLGNAEDGLHRAADLVQQLLAFSRNDATATVERTDVGTVVREAVRLVRPSLPASVELTTEVDDGCWIMGDSAQIHQVVTNLLTNAGQAMEEDNSRSEHRLSVDLRLLDVSGNQARRHLGLEPGRYVRLSVRDTGPGMDGATQDRIFEPFFSTKEAGSQKGTGLGLAVTHGIVQSHDGEVVVASEVGEGTTFDVYLPGTPVPSEEADPPPPCTWSDGRPVVAASTPG